MLAAINNNISGLPQLHQPLSATKTVEDNMQDFWNTWLNQQRRERLWSPLCFVPRVGRLARGGELVLYKFGINLRLHGQYACRERKLNVGRF